MSTDRLAPKTSEMPETSTTGTDYVRLNSLGLARMRAEPDRFRGEIGERVRECGEYDFQGQDDFGSMDDELPEPRSEV